MPRRSWALWAVIVAGGLGLQAWALWGERHGTAANPPARPNWPVGEIAEGIVAEQTFVMRVPGLRSFTFTPRAVGPTVVGDVIFDVLDVTPEGDRSLFRVIKKGSRVVRDGRPYTLEFSPIDLPVPRTFKVRIALPDAKFGQGFYIDGVEQDRYREGVLVVNFTEVWGDLAFDTDARAARMIGRLDELGRGYPWWLRAPQTVVTAVALVNLVFAYVLWLALAPAGSREAESTSPAGAWRGWAAIRTNVLTAAAIGAILVGALWAMQLMQPRVVVDLAATFPAAEKRTSMPSLHEGFSIFDYTTIGVVETCILALPSSRITWTVDVVGDEMLTVRAGLRPDVWALDGDGALFRVGVTSPRGYEELRTLYLNPRVPYGGRYEQMRFDLARFAGQRVKVVFNVEPGLANNAVNDAALWCAPRIIDP